MLDKIDLEILRLLQENARISNAELARELGMVPSGMLERVKKLEQKNVILHYHTRINPVALNQNMLAFVFLKVSPANDYKVTATILSDVPEIQEIHQLAGDDCYLLKIRTYDTTSLMHIMRNSISKLPHILSTRTTIVLETVKEQQQMVIPQNK